MKNNKSLPFGYHNKNLIWYIQVYLLINK